MVKTVNWGHRQEIVIDSFPKKKEEDCSWGYASGKYRIIIDFYIWEINIQFCEGSPLINYLYIMSEIIPGDNCNFIFKKRTIKNKTNRKRQFSESPVGLYI